MRFQNSACLQDRVAPENAETTAAWKGGPAGGAALSRGQHYKPRNHEAHGAAEEYVGWEMVAAGDAGEADCASHTVGDPGHPAMVAITVSDDRRDRKGRHGVHGIKATGVKWIVGAVEKAISIRAVAGVAQRLQSPADSLEGQIQRETIREGFRGEKCGGLRVRILFDQTDGIDRCGHGGDEGSGVRPAEDAIETAEAVRGPEVRSAVRVRGDERGCDAEDGDGRKPMLSFGQAPGKEPNFLLIGDEIRGESAERDLAIRWSQGSRPRLRSGRGGGGGRGGVRGLLG